MRSDVNPKTYRELRRFTSAFLCGVVGVVLGFLANASAWTWLEIVADVIVVVSLALCFIFVARGVWHSLGGVRRDLTSSGTATRNERESTPERQSSIKQPR